MDNKNAIIAELENISEILFDNGYNSWGNAIRKAVILINKQAEERDRALRHATTLAANAAVQPDIVVCKECKWMIDGTCKMFRKWYDPEWYCADGVRKEGQVKIK